MSDIDERLADALAPRYEVLGLAGEGGMSLVYRARDRERGQTVAIKVFRPELSSELTEARFLREIEIVADLDHPNIVSVLDSGSSAGILYYVMPFLEGETLRQRLDREGPLPVDEALRIVGEVGEGLAHAHGSGFIHRDIKPENIMLARDRAMIADFGVARVLASAGRRLTQSGFSVGTPMYMSPEQAAGDRTVDTRSDEYSLACVLFEMLVGEPPFTGPTSRAVIARHIQEVPPSVSVVRPGVPPGVASAVKRALGKAPADRFPSVPRFIAALSRPDAPGSEPSRVSARHVVALTAAALGLTAVWMWTRSAPTELDANRVMIFPPLDERSPDGVNDPVATYIPYVLEGTDPLRWEEGRDWKDPEAEMRDLQLRDRLRISREAGAAYFIDGSVIPTGDSVTVVLRLFDVATGERLERVGRSGSAIASEARLGASAMGELLGAIIEPGRPADLGALAQRHPQAIANFYQGEVAYRLTHFDEARSHYEAAVAADSLFAIAAVKGAQAASWEEDQEGALSLARAALRHDSLLPPKYAGLVRGIEHYLIGRADRALADLEAVLEDHPSWAEAHAAAGEVFYHLMPRRAGLDSLAAAELEAAVQLDSAFSPPRYHLAEMAIREGDLDRAASMVEALRAASPDRRIDGQLEVMMACAESGADAVGWSALADTAAYVAIAAAQAIASSDRLAPCVEQATVALLEARTQESWGAWLVLQGLLLTQGRIDELLEWTRSPQVAHLPADRLLLLDGRIDPALAPEADRIYEGLGTDFENVSAPNRWLMLQWASASGRTADLEEMARVFLEEEAVSGTRRDSLFARIAEAHVAARLGRVDEALDRLRNLQPTAPAADLQWQPWEALAGERILLAELLLAQDSAAAVRRVLTDAVSHRAVVQLVFARSRDRLLDEAARAAGR